MTEMIVYECERKKREREREMAGNFFFLLLLSLTLQKGKHMNPLQFFKFRWNFARLI